MIIGLPGCPSTRQSRVDEMDERLYLASTVNNE